MKKINLKKVIATVSTATLMCTSGAFFPNAILSNAASGNDICTLAQNDVGKDRSQVGCSGSGDWCALYATKTAKKAGIDLSYCRRPDSCSELSYDFLKAGNYHSKKTQAYKTYQTALNVSANTLKNAYDPNYIPKPGDFILYDWNASETYSSEPQPDHIGIVEYVSGGRVYTIEGNRGGCSTVTRRNTKLDDDLIHGYVSFGGSSYATLPGDLDLNGQVDLTDCTYLSMYLLGDTTFEKIAGNAAATKANADVNCDGEVDIADVSALKVLVTTPSNNTSTTVSYAVSLTAGTPIYAEPGSSTINQTLSASGTFTITKEKTVNGVKYGYLKSGAGWVKLSNTNANTGEISVNYAKYLAKGTVILKDAGSSTINQTLSASGTFTITKEKTVNGVKYGYLKSGAGWVKL